MKAKTLVLVAIPAVAAAVWMARSDEPDAPDRRIGARLAKICPIARDNVDTPLHGVSELGHYLSDNSPALLHDFAETVAMIERIDDPRRHDRRAEVAHQRMFGPVSRCHRELAAFFDAIEDDDDAREAWEEGSARVGRTIGILLGETPDALRDPRAVRDLLLGK